MPVTQVFTGYPAKAPEQSLVNAPGGFNGEQLASELHGKYFTQTYKKNMWHASNASGSPVAVPLFATNATPTFAIFNPAGNTTAVVLHRINFGWTAGTGIAGSIGYAYLPNAGTATAGTAAPISTSTAGQTIQMGVCGQTYGGNIKLLASATIGGAVQQLQLHKWSAIGQGAPITTTTNIYNLFEEFDGSVIIPPNTLWAPVASVAIAETFQISLAAYEIPWN